MECSRCRLFVGLGSNLAINAGIRASPGRDIVDSKATPQTGCRGIDAPTPPVVNLALISDSLIWVSSLFSGILMSAIAPVGSVTLMLKEQTLRRILLGGLVTYFFSFTYDLSWLIPFAAGNFLYIGASDLVPEVNKHAESSSNFISFAAFAAGLALLFGVKLMLG